MSPIKTALYSAALITHLALAPNCSALADACSDRTAAELQKSTFASCKGCHTNADVAPPWLKGSSSEVFTNVTTLLKNPLVPYVSAEQNLIVAKPFAATLSHGGGKNFPSATKGNVMQFLSDLDSSGCLEGIKPATPEPVETPSPVTGQLKVAPPTYSQLEHFLGALTGNPNGRTLQYLSSYKTQLGYSDSRTQADSRLPITPISMAVLNKILAWGCAEAADRRNWALIERSAFESTLTDFVVEMLGLPQLQAKVLAKNILSQEDVRTRTGKSIRASRVSACYTILKSERLWLR
jgi:hypothetical protein